MIKTWFKHIFISQSENRLYQHLLLIKTSFVTTNAWPTIKQSFTMYNPICSHCKRKRLSHCLTNACITLNAHVWWLLMKNSIIPQLVLLLVLSRWYFPFSLSYWITKHPFKFWWSIFLGILVLWSIRIREQNVEYICIEWYRLCVTKQWNWPRFPLFQSC